MILSLMLASFMNVFVVVTSANPRRTEHVAPLKMLSVRTLIASVINADEEVNVQRSTRMNGRLVGNSWAQKHGIIT